MTDDDEMQILDALRRLDARLGRLDGRLEHLQMVFEHEFALMRMQLETMLTETGQQVV